MVKKTPKRHKPYSESVHVMNLVYNLLTCGEAIVDIERLQEERSFLKVLGAERVSDPTTAGDFLARFSDADISGFLSTLRIVAFARWVFQYQ